MDWTNDLVLEFLALYEAEPAIWDIKNPDHKKREQVEDAWKRIAFAMSVNCSVKELKRKRDSLMSIFRALCIKKGANCKHFKPNWFAFETMQTFLRNVYEPKVRVNSKENNSKVQGIDHLNGSPRFVKTDSSNSTSSSTKIKPRNHRLKKPKKASNSQISGVLNIFNNLFDTKAKDDCELFGELLAMKLRTIAEEAREILMNDIDNLVFLTKVNSKIGHSDSVLTEYSDENADVISQN